MNFMVLNSDKKSGRRFSLKSLFRGTGVALPKRAGDLEISGLTDDSRQVREGDLFVAVPGHQVDGRRFITEASSLGAAAVLTAEGTDIHADIPIVISRNLRRDLALIADNYFDKPSSKMTVAGITGTNGKTTTSFLLAEIFGAAGKKWGKLGTVGYYVGKRVIPAANTTPGIINTQRCLAEMLESGLSGCSMEVSSHALDQGRALGIKFASATFMNLSQDHLDYHKDMDSYFESKARLFESIPVSVINTDDPYGRKLAERVSGNVVTFGTTADAGFRFRRGNMNIDGSILSFEYNRAVTEFLFPLPGIFNHQNAAAAAATAVALGLSLEQSVEGLRNAHAVPGRLQPINMGQPFAVFVDYAHTPDALEKLLASLREFNPRELHIVFGCGGDRDRKKRPIMGRVTTTLADRVYLTSDNPRTEEPGAIIEDALKGIVDRKKCQVIEDRALAIRTAVSKLSPGDILVIAGKGHEDYQVVGTVKKYFSDIEVAASELRKQGYENGG